MPRSTSSHGTAPRPAGWALTATTGLCAALTERTGARATTAIKSLNRLLAAFGVRKLGLVTPYTPDVQQQIIANYAAHRDRDRGRAAQQPVGQFLFRGALRRRDRGHVPRGGRGAADAIAIVCTNMRGPLVAAGLERELGIPVLDSVAFTLWGCLKEAGTDMTPLSEFGMMFSK